MPYSCTPQPFPDHGHTQTMVTLAQQSKTSFTAKGLGSVAAPRDVDVDCECNTVTRGLGNFGLEPHDSKCGVWMRSLDLNWELVF